jgi:multidrug resistance efflux pump
VEHYKAAAEQAESELNEKRSTFEQMTIDFNGLQAQINELQGQLAIVSMCTVFAWRQYWAGQLPSTMTVIHSFVWQHSSSDC